MRRGIYLPFFERKKITVMGVGLLGRGVGDISFLASCDAEIIATDKKSEKELASSLELLKDYKNITYRLGEHRLEDFENRDFILKAAGVPLDSEFVSHAREMNVPIYMSAALLTKIVKEKLQDVTVIGVTGTRGKSTVTHLINHILVSAGKKVHLGGNVRGVANLPILNEIENGDYLLMELDSWQLQGFGDLKISPNVAVFTSFLDDHLNYYHGNKELYFKDKSNIFINQKGDDVCIVSEQTKEEFDKRNVKAKVIVPQVEIVKSFLIGKHNQVAISLAIEVVKHYSINKDEAIKSVGSFKAVDGRLEYMGEYSGRKVFNDNNSTTPDAVIVAIKSISETFNKKAIIILGGADKNISLENLERELPKNTKEIIYLSGVGTSKINLPKKYEYENLKDCVDKAFELSDEGDIILFSPGFSSKSKYFNNEYERNDFFVACIEKYNR